MPFKNSASPSESVRKLVELYEGLTLDAKLRIKASDYWLFVRTEHDPDVPLPTGVACILHDGHAHFLAPRDCELGDKLAKCATTWIEDSYVAYQGVAHIPERDAPEPEIAGMLWAYYSTIREASGKRQAAALLEEERSPYANLYAGAAHIEQDVPMLVDGLMRERGVSVIFGDFDEFKTTVVLDMMAHVAAGWPWQGRKVSPRPAIWYALEGSDEIPVRVRGLEDRLTGKDTDWGDDRLPITVRDRIPEDPIEWRKELNRLVDRWDDIWRARSDFSGTAELPMRVWDGDQVERYPEIGVFKDSVKPVVVIDTLSIALGGADEKGPAAVEFVNRCLDLLKERPDLDDSDKDNPLWLHYPVASHVIIVHHQTKNGVDFAGHRAIAGDTQGLYRIHRFGKISDKDRPLAGQLTPLRVKGIPRPAPLRFEVEIVPIEGTRQTAAILKDKAAEVPKELAPVIEALLTLEDPEKITPADLNECLDVLAKGKDDAAKRKARQRNREKLEAAGVIEPVEDANGSIAFYRFHDAERRALGRLQAGIT